ncbi:uncharacterized protein PITG_22129 [Phytophthora infestans T30-4]|uniref:Uncharacterized protein n=1 Tax=Phytophthora infestans (strain T30-4) TaxID=403677 RepID=D0P4Y2_PHYIT|nr:uncharacterized protein PITG_22129 [Phytophthora infestans T30-4]EEY54630.1 conserved hypothetical protein [Phytophthora infestans T30-4]|eukprot:XP_002894715.1 conserved hypothetical protein [Phytophthora infestans T30-4]
MAFCCVGSPLDEMKRLEKLRERDPESAENLVANGKLLVDFVRNGNLRALQCAAEHLGEGQMLIFYATSYTASSRTSTVHKVRRLCSHLFASFWMLVSMSIGKGRRISTLLCMLHAVRTCTPSRICWFFMAPT